MKIGDEWGSPEWLIDMARSVMGDIDLDPASNQRSQGIVKARRHFTIRADGLSRTWGGRVWLNPPYSKVMPWAEKLRSSSLVTDAVVIVNSGTETAWYHLLMEHCQAMCLPTKRVAFLDLDNKPASMTRAGQTVFYAGEHALRFHRTFESVGRVLDLGRAS